jgi:nucleosome binding factor SPN SPT16 subunit
VTIVDEDKKVKHSKFAEGIEHSYVHNAKLLPPQVDPDSVELCYDPIVQSGKDYQLKFSTVSNDDILQFGTILCSFGFRFKSYCSNIVRTLFVEPSEVSFL